MADDETLSEGEHFVLRLHPHWKTLLRPFIILLVILAAAIVALVMIPSGSNAGLAREIIGILVFLAGSSSTRFPTSSRCSPRCSSWSRTSRPAWPGKIAEPVH